MNTTPHNRETKVALPKGRYIGLSSQVLNHFGIKRIDNLYRYRTEDGSYLFVLLKPSDTARLVLHGIFDMGISPDEWVIESLIASSRKLPKLESQGKPLSLPAYRTRLSLLVCDNSPCPIDKIRRVATTYPNITRHYFKEKHLNPDIIEVSGSTESLVGDVCDAAVDIVESGASAKAHSLMEQDCIVARMGMSWIKSKRSADFPSWSFEKMANAA